MLQKHQESLTQSELQFGFTKSRNPVMAALVLTEAIAEARDQDTPLYVATLDASKAFDVVDHTSLKRRLYLSNPELWRSTVLLLEDNTSQVKIDSALSPSYPVLQGVGQGRILSTENYKLYIDPLLQLLKQLGFGQHIGTHFIGAPTCADDVLLISSSEVDLQAMLDAAHSFACRERYVLHPGKSAILSYHHAPDYPFSMEEDLLLRPASTSHLGIERETNKPHPDAFIDSRIALTRRTVHALMGTGLHGLNGLSPRVSRHIYLTFVIPRMLYGLEAINIRPKQLRLLSNTHKRLLKQFQSLPDRTADAAVFTLIGIPPLPALLDIKIAVFAYSLANNSDLTREIMIRQLATKDDSSSSWFRYAEQRLQIYGLPHLISLITENYTADVWKGIVKSAILSYWKVKTEEDCAAKSTLRFLTWPEYTRLPFTDTHHVWRHIDPNTRDVRRAIVKARLLTGTYLLQSNRARFNGSSVSDICLLCSTEPEDTLHFVLCCPQLELRRRPYITEIHEQFPALCSLQPPELMTCLLDSTHLPSTVHNSLIPMFESISRKLLFALHTQRASILETP